MTAKILLAALIISASFSSYDAYAEALPPGSDGRGSVQAEEPLDFEDWYEPDEAYPEDGLQRPDEDKVVPEGDNNQPRVAPDEDTRPKER